jgi:hypothetical protein
MGIVSIRTMDTIQLGSRFLEQELTLSMFRDTDTHQVELH